MLRLTMLLFVQVMLFAVARPLDGQIDPDLYQNVEHTTISIGIDGQAQVSQSRVYNWKLPFLTFELISSKEVREELDLVPRQDQAIDSRLRQFETTRAKLAAKFRKENLDIREDYRLACQQLEVDLFAELVPGQVERLNEVYWQVELRKRGLIALVVEYQTKSDTKLSQGQLGQINNAMRQLNSDWVGKLQTKCKLSLDTFKKNLPESDQQPFSESVQDNPHFLNLDILELTSKRVLDQLESNEKPTDQASEVEDRLRKSEYYTLHADGQWKHITADRSFTGILLGWLAYPESSGLLDLELTESQLHELMQLKEEMIRSNDEITKSSNEMFDRRADDNEIRAFLNAEHESATKYAREKFFDKVLLPHQLDTMSKVLDRRDAAKNGPFQFIPKPEAMTDARRQRYIAALKALRKDLQRIHLEAGEFERRMIRESVEPVELAAATEIRKMIGKKPQHLKFSELLFRKTNGITADFTGK